MLRDRTVCELDLGARGESWENDLLSNIYGCSALRDNLRPSGKMFFDIHPEQGF